MRHKHWNPEQEPKRPDNPAYLDHRLPPDHPLLKDRPAYWGRTDKGEPRSPKELAERYGEEFFLAHTEKARRK